MKRALLPSGWRYVPLKRVAEVRFSAVDKHSLPDELPVRLCNYVDVYRNEHISPDLAFMAATATRKEMSRFLLRDGDVLLTKDSETPDDIAVPAVVTQDLDEVVCGYHLALLRSRPGLMDGRFLHRALQAAGVREQFHARAVGVTRFALGLGEVGAALIPVPPLQVQRAIVRYLQGRLDKLDTLITKHERLAALLRARQKTAAARCVTRGLSSEVPLRSSGVEWMGEIPSHWRVLRPRRLCSLTTGGRDTQDAVEDGPYPFFVRSPTVERIDTYSFDGEAVLTAGDGVGGVAKVFHYYVGKLEFHQRVYLYYEFKDILGRFYYYFLREWLAAVAKAGNAKITVDSLRRPMLLDFPVAVPPLDEQRAIVAYLDTTEAVTERARSSLLKQVQKLREYRDTLITAAVTGQLDVAEQPMEAA